MTSAPRLPKRVRFAESVRARLGPDRGFLFDQRTGRVYSVNASGALAAARIQDSAPVPEIIAAVVEAFQANADTVRRDFGHFIAQLVEEGLAECDG